MNLVDQFLREANLNFSGSFEDVTKKYHKVFGDRDPRCKGGAVMGPDGKWRFSDDEECNKTCGVDGQEEHLNLRYLRS